MKYKPENILTAEEILAWAKTLNKHKIITIHPTSGMGKAIKAEAARIKAHAKMEATVAGLKAFVKKITPSEAKHQHAEIEAFKKRLHSNK